MEREENNWAISYFNTKPIYEVKARLTAPPASELIDYQLTIDSKEEAPKPLTSNEVFEYFLAVIDSPAHKSKLTEGFSQSSQEAFGFILEEGSLNNTIRSIKTEKASEFSDTTYYLTIRGLNTNALKKFMAKDLEIASSNLKKQLKQRNLNKIKLSIKQISYQNQKSLKELINRIEARKQYLTASRKLTKEKLKKAIKLAQAISLVSPSELATSSTRNKGDELSVTYSYQKEEGNLDMSFSEGLGLELNYLRGEKLLTAELKSLESIPEDTYYDSGLAHLQAEYRAIEKSPEIKHLEQELTAQSNLNTKLSLVGSEIKVNTKPVNSSKSLIIAISLITGLVSGLLISTLAVVIRKNKPNAN